MDEPKRRGGRRDIAEQRLLITERTEICQAVTAIAEHHREITDHAALIVPRLPLLQTRQLARERPISPVLSATRANSAHPACETSPSPSGTTSTLIWRPSRVTFKVILQARFQGLDNPRIPAQADSQRPRPPGPQLLNAKSGLEGV